MSKPIVAVIVATEVEYGAARDVLTDVHPSFTNFGVIPAALAELDRVFLLVTQLGHMGNLDAALATSDIIRQYRPICVIGGGTCAGTQIHQTPKKFCDIVVSDGVIYYEPSKKVAPIADWRPRRFECTVQPNLRSRIVSPPASLFESKKPRRKDSPNPKVHNGYYASGDSVLGDEQFVQQLRSLAMNEYGIDPAAIEMEGAGIAMACSPTGTRFVLIKGIMDFAKDKNDEWQRCAAAVSLGSIVQWADSLSDEDITALHVRDLPSLKADPYQLATDLSLLAGSMLPPRGVSLLDVKKGGSPQLVTRYDLKIEEFMRSGLCSNGNAGFVGEAIKEYSACQIDQTTSKPINAATGKWWIVDAVDGTQNLIAARPEVALSVAFYEDCKAVVALIHLPYRRLTVATTPANVLLVNGVPWAKRRAPARSLAAAVVSLPGDIGRLRETGLESLMRELVLKAGAIRITGALAYDLACIALGEIDARISTSANLVDVAAGIALVHAIGGKVTDLQGNDWTPTANNMLAAATPELHAQILDAITNASEVAVAVKKIS